MLVTLHRLIVDLLLLLIVPGIFYQWISGILVTRFGKSRPSAAPEAWPVTLLKPVCGADAGLYENLRSFCLQDYGGPVQMVIGAHTEGDPAVPIVRRLIADFPDKDIELVIDGNLPGTNFKVCNLLNIMRAAKYDCLVLSDSDMRVEASYLRQIVADLQSPGVGLVTCLYKGTPWLGGDRSSQIASALGCAFINYGFLPSVLVAQAIGTDAGSFGASLALTRDTLLRAGGFESLLNQLADDYVLGARIRGLGLKVKISAYVIENLVAETDLRGLIRHELRWQRTIRSIQPVGLAASAITNPVAISLIALVISGFSGVAWAAFALSLAARTWLIYSCNTALRVQSLAFLLIPFRDALTLALLVASFFGQRVVWREQEFQLRPDGALTVDGDRVV